MRFVLSLLLLITMQVAIAEAYADDSGDISSRIEATEAEDLILIHEVNVEAPVSALWQAYATAEGWRAWVAPVVEMDFRIGGKIQSHYDSSKAVGDEGTITSFVRSYAPERFVLLQAEINENFPQFTAEEQANLSNLLVFEETNEGSRLTSYATGYRDTDKHRQMLEMFKVWNAAAFADLKRWLETGEAKQHP